MINVITQPMQHQEDALAKLLPSKWNAAFMDMGTGKSLVAILLATIRHQRDKIDRVIWFTPVSLKDNIRREIAKHTGDGSETHVFSAKTNETTVPDVFWNVVGLESMSSSNRTVLTVNKLMDERTMVIVDESGYIKGHKSKRTDRVTLLSGVARYRMIMTGTPISQGVVDLFSQMRFLSPKILGYHSFSGFSANHLEYSTKYPGLIVRSHNTEELANKIKPYVYQVTKEQCLQLPRKQQIHRFFSLTEEQKSEYEYAKHRLLEDLASWDEDGWGKSLTIFRLFGVLQQIACGYWNNKDAGEKYNYKHKRVELLLDVIGEIAPGEQIIIWCKYHHDIDQIAPALSKAWGEDQVCQYHGKLTDKQCNTNEQRFHQGAKFFLGTPSKGGHGLTLVESSYVIFYNNGFKYADRVQAEDRAHRIGQTRNVTYISLWADCGIEDRIHTALERKADALDEFRAEVEAIKEQAEGRKEKLKRLIKAL